MSEECREQRPLLCEDVSEEEQFSKHHHNRFRLLTHRGRASTNVKGAATVINRWPDHWSSALSHWWISLGMMALLTYVIYNSLIAFALPASAQKHREPLPKSEDRFISTYRLPEIYMHIFTEMDNEIDLMKYLPHIYIIADKYLDFNFNLVLVLNDTEISGNMISAEENNINAWNLIWSQEHLSKHISIKSNRDMFDLRKNVKIIHTTLSRLFDQSPLNSDWQYISPQLIPFLVKMVAIWDIGGIAINPDILTPRSPNKIYIDKFLNILNKFKTMRPKATLDNNPKKYLNKHKEHQEIEKMKKVNNIRDIIEILKHESDNNNTYSQENLTEVENRNNVVFKKGRKLLSTISFKPESNTKTEEKESDSNKTEVLDHKHKRNGDVRVRYETNEASDLTEIGFSPRLNILPLFFDFLFHDKSKMNTHKPENLEIDDHVVRRRKHSILIEKIRKNSSEFSTSLSEAEKSTTAQYKPIILSVKDTPPIDILKLNDSNHTETVQESIEELTIDLKGNIIATKASCHAFVGTVFSNAIHHTSQETVPDFIVDELSQFCKGLLSSCKGIDVILV